MHTECPTHLHPADQLRALDDVSKLDPSHARQVALAHGCFSHNMHAIGFWLHACVFPVEMQQFPRRLARSAWDLADSSHIVGFSGECADTHCGLLG